MYDLFIFILNLLCACMSTRAHWNLFLSVCMCAPVSTSAARVCERVCVCVCVCVSERATERERVRVFEIFDMNALKMDLPPLKRAMALYQ